MSRPYRDDADYQRSPAVRAKMSAARKRALADPAVRAKMSAASKRAWGDPAGCVAEAVAQAVAAQSSC